MIARKIDDSPISKSPPYVREIWFYLLRTANYADNHICKRGQTIRRYADIKDALKWYVGYRKCSYTSSQCENSMKLLTRAKMITKTKTTRGLCITIVNYDTYQDPKSYESHNESHNEKPARATRLPHYKQEGKEGNKKEERILQEAFIDYWKSKDSLPTIKSLSDERKAKLKKRISEPFFAKHWKEIIDKIIVSPFLMGRNDKKWKASLEWILVNNNNYVKVMEGKYDGADSPKQPPVIG